MYYSIIHVYVQYMYDVHVVQDSNNVNDNYRAGLSVHNS